MWMILQVIILCCFAYEYIKHKRVLRNIIHKMQMDDLINELIESPHPQQPKQPITESQHRNRLITLAAGGQMRKYNLKVYTIEEIESMKDEEIKKLYARYESNFRYSSFTTLFSFCKYVFTHSS